MSSRSSRSTLSPVAADTGTISANCPSRPYCSMIGSSRVFLIRSILLRIRKTGASTSLTQIEHELSPLPVGSLTSTTRPSTSTSRIVSTAASTIRTFIRCSGRWMPGVSRNTTWRVRVVPHAENPRPRRLRLVGHDRELRADQPVQQRRLARVRAADERDEAELHEPCGSASTGSSCFTIRTLLMRRRSASSTSTVSPSMSNRSPTAGTRPRCESR